MMSVEDQVRAAYDRGFFVGTARAKNRVERGEPIGYDDKPTDADYRMDQAQAAVAQAEAGMVTRAGYFEQARTEGG